MSNYHASIDANHQPARVHATTLDVIASLSGTVLAGVARLATEFGPRRSRDLSQLSDHLLRDLGFERDWDGSINPIVKH